MNAFDLNLRVKLKEKNTRRRNLTNLKDFLENRENRENKNELSSDNNKYYINNIKISNSKIYENTFIDKLEYFII